MNKYCIALFCLYMGTQKVVLGQMLLPDLDQMIPKFKMDFNGPKFDDRYHNISQIAEENGFIFEEYEVVTEDGYILMLHRIRENTTSSDSDQKPIVLLQHGIEDASIQWVINDVDKAPAFMLSRSGFDVWLGNNRGNTYGLRHVNLTKDQKEFWDFDFEQMGLYDVPAFLETILKTTGAKKINAYMGHSEGTT